MVGAELDRLPVEQAPERIERTSVFARVTPAHKMKIVGALQSRGHVVAVTGDGVNDAPALKKAHIGVAMGRSGTEVAKEAATMVLTDDNFATIVGAVGEGRTIYSNIVKFVRYQLSTNIGALLSMLTASLLGWPAPFNPIQILWVNIIMDGPPAMAMGLDPARPEVMRERPRSPDEEMLSWRRLGLLMAFGSIMVIGSLGMLQYGLWRGEGGLPRALTLAFTTFVLFQLFNAFNARVERGSALTRRFFSNLPLWLSLIGVAALQVVAVEWGPAQSIFRTVDLSWNDWGLCALVAASILVYGEAHRGLRWLIEGERRRAAR
jgi:Ca2+-transporting ATPase